MAEEINYGRVAIIPKGEFKGDVQYDIGDVVTYQGSSYLAFVRPPLATLPTDTNYWQLSARGFEEDSAENILADDNYQLGFEKVQEFIDIVAEQAKKVLLTKEDMDDELSTTSENPVQNKVVEAALQKKAVKSTIIDTTLPASDWTGEEVPYSITVTVEGVTADTKVEGMEHPDCTAEEIEAYCNANIRTGITGDGTVTLKCFGTVPEIDLPARFIVRGD